MKFKSRKKTKKAKIEIIPMIDVMFFLLATFILASLSMQNINSLPVNLAKGKASLALEKEDVTITIDKNGWVFLNKELIKLELIQKKLSILLDEKNDKVIIAADKDCSHGLVVKVMAESKKAGVKHFSIITKN